MEWNNSLATTWEEVSQDQEPAAVLEGTILMNVLMCPGGRFPDKPKRAWKLQVSQLGKLGCVGISKERPDRWSSLEASARIERSTPCRPLPLHLADPSMNFVYEGDPILVSMRR